MNSGAALIGAIRGPVMLILVGLLFTADQFGSYEFGVTWPVLIVGFGVLKLLERTLGPRRSGEGVSGGTVS